MENQPRTQPDKKQMYNGFINMIAGGVIIVFLIVIMYKILMNVLT